MKGSLFTWSNFKLGVLELIKIYSSKDSLFSKKRIESGILFIILVFGSLKTLFNIVKTVQDFAIWAGVLTPFIVYSIYHIQKQKEKDE